MITPLDRRDYMSPGMDELANKISELVDAVNAHTETIRELTGSKVNSGRELAPGVEKVIASNGVIRYRRGNVFISLAEAYEN